MTKKVFIIHGWEAHPDDEWYPWLKKELENKGFQVEVPQMPNTDEPEIGAWVSFLKKKVGKPDADTFFVGHSIGCQTILRYLESLPSGVKVGGAVFVAGWFHLTGLETEEEKGTAKPWLETPIDFAKVKKHTNNFVAFFSDDDIFVPVSDSRLFKEKLGSKIIIKNKMGHFRIAEGVKEIPEVLNELLMMARS
jgi:predicted alpha/beta hydrolase family esterase